MATALDLTAMLEVRMSYDAERQKVLAQNIANIDTPGYRAQDLVPLDFRNVLAAQTHQVPMMVTSALHKNGNMPYTQQFRSADQRNSFEITPTGGSVVSEEQMIKVAQNAADYQMTTSLYKKVGNLFKEALGLAPSA